MKREAIINSRSFSQRKYVTEDQAMRNILRALLATATTGLLFVSNAYAQPGSVDLSFNAGLSVDSEVLQVALQSNGKVIVGGTFATPSPGLARLNADGSPDVTFHGGTGVDTAGYAGGVSVLAVQPDDKIIIGGTFNTYDGVGRTNIARINADGTLDLSFDPGQGIGEIVPKVLAIVLQPDGRILIGGQFSSVDGTNRFSIARLNTDGTLDTSFDPGNGVHGSLGSASVYALAVQPDGKVLLGGFFSTVNGTNVSNIARLNPDGSVDDTFNTGAGANDIVLSMAVQTNDNKILIGGNFTTVNNTNHSHIARLNADGSLDADFSPALVGTVNSIFPVPGGQMLVGGNFTKVNSTSRNHIARLNGDGTLDTTFNPGTGANEAVSGLALQANGDTVLGGSFTVINGVARNFVARLGTDGSVDSGFNPGETLNAVVNCMARQPDGRLIIGGNFTNINQTVRNRIARLNANGNLDTSFDPGSGVDSSSATVNAVALQSDGKVLLGGSFTSVNGVTYSGLARLNGNGGLDTSYNPILNAGFSGLVIALAVQPDDKVLIGGSFSKVNGTNRANLARLNADGTLDTSFNPGTGANAAVRAIVVRTNGEIIIGGNFTSYNGTNRNCIAGLNADGSLDPTFNVGTGFFFENPTLVDTFALQSDGKVLVGGHFDTYNGGGAEGLARLNMDGSLDTNFDTRTLNQGGFYIYAVAFQPDGKVLIGGDFSDLRSMGGGFGIARINTNGILDTTFNIGVGTLAPLNPWVYSVVLQPDSEVVIGGGFTSINSSARWYVARLYGDAPVFNSIDTANGSFGLQWTAIPGRTYRVQFTPDLSTTNWSDLPPDVLAVTNMASKADLPTNAQRFYRISLRP